MESRQIMDIFIQQIINGLVLGSMYALIALGYTMVYGVLNLINFAHGDVLMVGAMVGLTILKMINSVAPDLPGIVKLLLAIVGAIPVCVAVNILIERVAYRRLRNAPRSISGRSPLPSCAIRNVPVLSRMRMASPCSNVSLPNASSRPAARNAA